MRNNIAKSVTVAMFMVWGLPAIAADPVPPTPPTPPTVTPPTTEPSATANTANETDADADANKCSVASVNGAYGLQIQGFRTQGRKLIPYTAVRTATFDGQGKTSGKGMANISGRVVPYTVDGTYTVDEDCSITISGTQSFGQNNAANSESYNQFGVLVNGGDEILIMQSTGARSQFGRYEKY